jgi:hypothetical protein
MVQVSRETLSEFSSHLAKVVDESHLIYKGLIEQQASEEVLGAAAEMHSHILNAYNIAANSLKAMVTHRSRQPLGPSQDATAEEEDTDTDTDTDTDEAVEQNTNGGPDIVGDEPNEEDQDHDDLLDR